MIEATRGGHGCHPKAFNLPESSILIKDIQRKIRLLWPQLVLIFAAGFLSACDNPVLNSPYPANAPKQSIFYSSFTERPKHLDPARSYSSNEWAFISQIYEPPLQYHFLKRPYVLEPLTLKTMPIVTYLDDKGNLVSAEQALYTEYELSLKPGIRFQPHPAFARNQDGYRYWPMSESELTDKYTLDDFTEQGDRELTAEDYVYQIKRLAYVPNHSPVAGLMSEHIVGFADFMKSSKNLKPSQQDWVDLRDHSIEGVTLVDRYTWRIRIHKTYPQFEYWLAMNFFAPMAWEVERFYQQPGMESRNITLNWYPVGTGPFVLTENNPNLRMVLSKNPNFHGERYPTEGSVLDRNSGMLDDAGKVMPFIDMAIYSLEKEAIPRWNKFLQGYYDNSGIASDSFDQAIQFGASGDANLTDAMAEKGIQLSTAVETSIFYMGFNMKDPVVGGDLNDPVDQLRAQKLRRAIAMAFDWEEYISIFLNGRGEIAHGPLPPGIFGYKEGEAGLNRELYKWQNGAPKRKSIDQAKLLLAEAGYPEGRDPTTGSALILYYDTTQSGPGAKSLLQWYRNQFEKLGIELIIRSSDYNRFQEKMMKGSAQIFSWGWNADYPDPENFLFLLHGPNGKVDAKGENAANFSNAEFDRLFDQMKSMPNTDERQQVIDRMVEILREESPWLFGFFPRAYSLHHAWYRNALPHLMANNTLKYKRIDGDLRSQQQLAWNQPVIWPLLVLLGLLILVLYPAIRDYRARQRRAAR